MDMTQVGKRLQDLAEMLQDAYEIGFCHPSSQPAADTLEFGMLLRCFAPAIRSLADRYHCGKAFPEWVELQFLGAYSDFLKERESADELF